MRLAAYMHETERMIGALQADGSVQEITTVDSFYRDPGSWLRSPSDAKPVRRPARGEMLPAIPLTARVICVGLNYKDHAAEVGLPWPQEPVIFARWASTLVADGAAVPQAEDRFDWEGELAVIMGREAHEVAEADAIGAVLGYAAFNDLSARTWQTLSPQWTLGKCSDASAPISAITTCDEVPDPASGLRLTTRVNGELVQDGSTREMIFSVGRIVAFVSRFMTLRPGDVIATGTPAGVGLGRKPPRFLKPGDTVEVEIESVGRVCALIVPRIRSRDSPPAER